MVGSLSSVQRLAAVSGCRKTRWTRTRVTLRSLHGRQEYFLLGEGRYLGSLGRSWNIADGRRPVQLVSARRGQHSDELHLRGLYDLRARLQVCGVLPDGYWEWVSVC